MGIIGGSGLDDPEILDDRREIYRETPYGMIERCTLNNTLVSYLVFFFHLHAPSMDELEFV